MHLGYVKVFVKWIGKVRLRNLLRNVWIFYKSVLLLASRGRTSKIIKA